MEAKNTDTQEETRKKRPSEHVSEDEASKPKKPKLYSVKQFRKQLHTNEKLQGEPILTLSLQILYTFYLFQHCQSFQAP